MSKHEPIQDIKKRRDAVLKALSEQIPFHNFMGISFERKGDELTGVMNYGKHLIGNPIVERLHGGGTKAFLEGTAVITLAWKLLWDQMESGDLDLDELAAGTLPALPKTINFTTDYLRPGLPRDAYARARINRIGRRYASVHVEAWQDHREVLFVQANGHFKMP